MLQHKKKTKESEFCPFKTKVIENIHPNLSTNFTSKIILSQNKINKNKHSSKSNFISIKCDDQDKITNQNNRSKENDIIENEEIDNEDVNKFHTGRWTNEEHMKFIDGILEHGNEWKKVQQIIGTRSSTQARSHAQKFFLKMKKEIRFEMMDKNKILESIIDKILPKNKKELLTKEQKEKLLNAIRSNIKSDGDFNNDNNQEPDKKISEEDNLIYEKEVENNEFKSKSHKESLDLFNLNQNERKSSFFKKRKSSRISDTKEKIFTIQKSHKSSMDITPKKANVQEAYNNLVNVEQKKENNKPNDGNNNSNKNNFIIQNIFNVTNNYVGGNYCCNCNNNDMNNNFMDNYMWNSHNDIINNERNQNAIYDNYSDNFRSFFKPSFNNINQFIGKTNEDNINENDNNDLNYIEYNYDNIQNYKGNNNEYEHQITGKDDNSIFKYPGVLEKIQQ